MVPSVGELVEKKKKVYATLTDLVKSYDEVNIRKSLETLTRWCVKKTSDCW